MFAVQFGIGITFGGPLSEPDSNKRRGAKMGPLFESHPRPLLKSGLQPLARYDTHQVGDLNSCNSI